MEVVLPSVEHVSGDFDEIMGGNGDVVTLKVVCDRDVAHELVRRLPAGCPHDVVKKVLPGPTKAAEVVITASISGWRHFIKLNAHISANPDIKAIADLALAIFIMGAQPLFEDLWEEVNQNENQKGKVDTMTRYGGIAGGGDCTLDDLIEALGMTKDPPSEKPKVTKPKSQWSGAKPKEQAGVPSNDTPYGGDAA